MANTFSAQMSKQWEGDATLRSFVRSTSLQSRYPNLSAGRECPHDINDAEFSFDSVAGGSAITVQTFRELLTQRPFRPFRLVMSSGETYEVRHPEMAWPTRSGILVGIDETEEGVPAEFRICSLLHVATIGPLNPVHPT